MRVRVRPLDGGAAAVLAPGLPAPQRLPRWSPDGRTLAVQAAGRIWAVPAGGGAPRRVLAIAPAQETQLGWAEWGADGRTLLYKWVDADGRASVWALPAACTAAVPAAAGACAPRAVVRLDDPRRPSPRPEFATDGRRVYLTVAERASDVWVMALGAEPR